VSQPSEPSRTIAIVPVKELAIAKSRLADRLTPWKRIALVERLLDHVLRVLLESPGIGQVVVVRFVRSGVGVVLASSIARAVRTPCTAVPTPLPRWCG